MYLVKMKDRDKIRPYQISFQIHIWTHLLQLQVRLLNYSRNLEVGGRPKTQNRSFLPTCDHNQVFKTLLLVATSCMEGGESCIMYMRKPA